MIGHVMPETIPERPETAHLLGRLEGRMEALELRLTRYEATTDTRLQSIEQKLDLLQHSVSQGLGGIRVAHWIGGAILALSGYAVSHLWSKL